MASHLRAALEPLFVKHHVDLALWAHEHKYERFCGVVSNGTCAALDEEGTVHVIIGNAGNDYQLQWDQTSGTHRYPPHNPLSVLPLLRAFPRQDTTACD